MTNVVLLTIDALRKDVLGCWGGCDGLSPFIDSVVKEDGLKINKHHTVAPYTQASFPGILTSSYFFDYEKSEKLSLQRTIISEALKKHGIYSAGFHSNPYLSAYFGWDRGWNHFYDSMGDEVTQMNPYIKGNVINQVVDKWFSSYKTGNDYEPFFLWVHYMDVHEPYIPDKKYIERVDSSINLSNEEMFKLFKEVILPRYISNKEKVEVLKKLYKAQIIETDEYIKELFELLKKHEVLDDSVVIITTDHGDEFSDHGGLSHDGKMYSELVNCPLMIIHNVEKGECDKLVSGLDISPTILHLFGLDPEPNFQGHSLLPTDKYPEKGCFGEAIGKLSHKLKPTDKPVYYYREKDIKIMYREEDDKWEMYDLASDPKETNNIIDSSPLAKEMKNKLKPRINRAPRS